jgi:hypothetical protein
MFPHARNPWFRSGSMNGAFAAQLPSPADDPFIHSLFECHERCMGEEN